MAGRMSHSTLTRTEKLITLTAACIATASALARANRARRRIDFDGRVVVITGGSRGLGLLLARHVSAQGAKVALLARDEDELTRARVELQSQGREVLTVACDVGEWSDVDRAIQMVLQH